MDGLDLGLVKLPWSCFEINLGALKGGEHEIVAAVDSMTDPEHMKLFYDYYDFYPFGGFHHGIRIEGTSYAAAYRRVVVRTRDYRTGEVELQLDSEPGLKPPMDGAILVETVRELFRSKKW